MSNTNTKLKQEDLLIDPNKKIEKRLLKKVEKNIEINKNLSSEYKCSVKLSSCGKLSPPNILHFKDYSLENLIDLNNHLRDEKYLETLIRVLNTMIYEDFNCEDLTEEELIEVLMYIHTCYHSNFISNIPYKIDEKIDNDDSNLELASIDIKDINTDILHEEFKEPFKLTYENISYYFQLPRIKNSIFAKNYVEEKYYEQEKKYSSLKVLLLENRGIKDPVKRFNIDEKDKKEYSKFVESKALDMIRITTSMNLYGKNDDQGNLIKFKDEDKIVEYDNVPRVLWSYYISIKKKYCKFGVNEKVKFFSTKLEKSISRRLAFRSMDFIPSLQFTDTKEIDVQFGLSS